MKNHYTNPLDGRSGNTLELLKSLTEEELRQYIACYQWRRANESLPDKPKNMYQSKSYFAYRASQFIHDAQKLLKDGERHEPAAD
jgi:hypothetical protein